MADDKPKKRPATATDRDFEALARIEAEKLAKATKAARDAAKGTGNISVDPDLTPVEDLIAEVDADVKTQEAELGALGFGPLRESPEAIARRIAASGVKVMARHTAVAVATCATYTDAPTIHARLTEIEKTVGFWKRVAFAAAGLAVSAVVAFVSFVYKRGVAEGANEQRLQFLERTVFGRLFAPFSAPTPDAPGGHP